MRTVFVLFALVVVCQAGLVRRDTGSETPALEEAVVKVQDGLKTFAEQVATIFTPGEQQKQTFARVGETLGNQTATFNANFQSFIDNLSNAAKDLQNLVAQKKD